MTSSVRLQRDVVWIVGLDLLVCRGQALFEPLYKRRGLKEWSRGGVCCEGLDDDTRCSAGASLSLMLGCQ